MALLCPLWIAQQDDDLNVWMVCVSVVYHWRCVFSLVASSFFPFIIKSHFRSVAQQRENLIYFLCCWCFFFRLVCKLIIIVLFCPYVYIFSFESINRAGLSDWNWNFRFGFPFFVNHSRFCAVRNRNPKWKGFF